MSDQYWDNSEEVRSSGHMEGHGTYIIVNGSKINVEPGSSFKDAVKLQAENAGLGKFRVLFNGEDIRPSQAPDFISEDDKIELMPYDVAGK